MVAKGIRERSQRAGRAATGQFRRSRRSPMYSKMRFTAGGGCEVNTRTLWKRSRCLSICRRHARDRLPAAARGARRHDVDAYLQLDLEDVVLAGTEAEVRLRVVDKAGSVLDVGNVGGNVGGKRFLANRRDDGWWSAQLPALEEGVHSLMLSATGVPNVDRLVLKTQVGAAS